MLGMRLLTLSFSKTGPRGRRLSRRRLQPRLRNVTTTSLLVPSKSRRRRWESRARQRRSRRSPRASRDETRAQEERGRRERALKAKRRRSSGPSFIRRFGSQHYLLFYFACKADRFLLLSITRCGDTQALRVVCRRSERSVRQHIVFHHFDDPRCQRRIVLALAGAASKRTSALPPCWSLRRRGALTGLTLCLSQLRKNSTTPARKA